MPLKLGWGAGAIADYPWHLDKSAPWYPEQTLHVLELIKGLDSKEIEAIDTAHRYGHGLSETTLGTARNLGILQGIHIWTKIEMRDDLINMEDDFNLSLERLGGFMSGLLLHDPNFGNSFNFWKVAEWMAAKKEKHGLSWIGISTEPCRIAVDLAQDYGLNAIQFPYSFWDRRAEMEIFQFAKEDVYLIANRVLGGPEMDKSIDKVRTAMQFIKANARINLALIGTSKIKHLKQCLEEFNSA